MIPPKGFRSTLHPLRHTLNYAAGLSIGTADKNSTMFTLVKNYKTVTDPATTIVNPKATDFDVETGAICAPMSIIDKLSLTMHFSFTKNSATVDLLQQFKFSWTPIFFSFPEKLDAKDQESNLTVAQILELTKDATQEDVTPMWSNVDLSTVGTSDRLHPASSVNLVEAYTIMNLTTDTKMESVAFDAAKFYDALKYYTNKGALKACMGRTRHESLSFGRRQLTVHINKFDRDDVSMFSTPAIFKFNFRIYRFLRII